MRRSVACRVLADSYFLSVFLLFFAFAALPTFASTEIFDQTYPLPAGGVFALSNTNGTVQVDGWDRNQVEVRAIKTALHDPQDLQRVQIDVETDGDSVTVGTRYPRGSGVEVTVEYHIRVPYRIQLAALETVNGDVNVRGVSGAGVLNSINGSVEVVDSDGRFSARTTNGDVRLQLRSLPQGDPMELSTVNGSIVLSVPIDAAAEIAVVNRNGDFRSDFPLRTLGAYSSTVFRGQLGTGGGEISMRTVNGGIRLVQGRPIV
ncbi:MAG TPA: DUF4097 family beta strand repeat-containing protein [Candidatus Acidoferrales bacterium]|nr:DUF4097 family beta strand repeat-containing protein [Candidatus Acidoferrales bacterium]